MGHEQPDAAAQDPVEGSRDIVERELKRQGDGKEHGQSGEPASAGRATKRKGLDEPTRH